MDETYKVSALYIFDQAFGSTEALLDTWEVLLLMLVRFACFAQFWLQCCSVGVIKDGHCGMHTIVVSISSKRQNLPKEAQCLNVVCSSSNLYSETRMVCVGIIFTCTLLIREAPFYPHDKNHNIKRTTLLIQMTLVFFSHETHPNESKHFVVRFPFESATNSSVPLPVLHMDARKLSMLSEVTKHLMHMLEW